MAVNVLAPTGFVPSRHLLGAAPTYQTTIRYIQRLYGTNLGIGDVVSTTAGYVVAQTGNPVLGVFLGVLPYYDINMQQTWHGLNGAYQSTLLPPVGTDLQCYVCTDPFQVFRVQFSGGPWAASWMGLNVALNGNAAPNAAGISTAYINGQATTATLPFRIVGQSGVTGGPQDPANTNPWLEVVINPGIAETLSGTGV